MTMARDSSYFIIDQFERMKNASFANLLAKLVFRNEEIGHAVFSLSIFSVEDSERFDPGQDNVFDHLRGQSSHTAHENTGSTQSVAIIGIIWY